MTWGARRSLVSVGVLGHSGSLLALLMNIPASDNNLGPEDHHYTGHVKLEKMFNARNLG
jgi:hypothetical protein